MKNKGFTLIELLVVIAIIGVLSSIVLSSLNNARRKGNDGKTKTQLSSLRSAMEIYYNGTGNYTYGTATNSCDQAFDNTLIAPYVDNLPAGVTPNCRATATPGYAVFANLLSTTGYWCVDYTGVSKLIGSALANGDDTCN
jgi:prepilin-type N-terminal cleavage/methylation domain-containing protein